MNAFTRPKSIEGCAVTVVDDPHQDFFESMKQTRFGSIVVGVTVPTSFAIFLEIAYVGFLGGDVRVLLPALYFGPLHIACAFVSGATLGPSRDYS